MKKDQRWIKIPTLVFFFSSIACIVAYRVGAFSGPAPVQANLATVSDSPQTKQPVIYSTKSGRIIEPKSTATTPDSQKQKFYMPGSKSMIMTEPQVVSKPDSTKSSPSPAQQKKAERKKASKKAAQKNTKKSNNSQLVIPSSKSGPVFVPNGE